MHLNELQAEVGQWAEHNFAPIEWHWPLLGIVEEVGELCEAAQTDSQAVLQMAQHVGKLAHLHLKEEQGIRPDPKAGHKKWALAMELFTTLVSYRPQTNQGGEEPCDDTGRIRDALADLLIFMCCFAYRMGWDLSEVVEQTWQQVKQRDWKRFPQNGVDA